MVVQPPTVVRWHRQGFKDYWRWKCQRGRSGRSRYLLRDRDSVYGDRFRRRVAGLEVTEVLTAPRAPWQNPYAERAIGSIRRERLDHVIGLGEAHLRRVLGAYLSYHRYERRAA